MPEECTIPSHLPSANIPAESGGERPTQLPTSGSLSAKGVWYVIHAGVEVGPLSLAELVGKAALGEIASDELVRETEGLWTAARNCVFLQEQFLSKVSKENTNAAASRSPNDDIAASRNADQIAHSKDHEPGHFPTRTAVIVASVLLLISFVGAWSFWPSTNSKPPQGGDPEPAKQLNAESLYASVSSAVVTLTVKNDNGENIGLGSGFFLKGDAVRDQTEFRESADIVSKIEGQPVQSGYLVTNYHVIRPAVDAEVTMNGGYHCIVWEVVSEDEDADLALLAIHVLSANKLTELPLADETPSVGTGVYAIGSPQGLANSLSAGIVSGCREIKPGTPWLQTTAPISPGSSGGPLLTSDGRVVGITTANRREGQNLNFAVPVSNLRQLLAAPYRTRQLSTGRSIRKQENDAFFQPLGEYSVLRAFGNNERF